MSVDAIVDLSQSLGPTHFQGKRNTCLAFALSDMNRHINNAGTPLSAEYLYRCAAQRIPNWRPKDGLLIEPALAAVKLPGQPTALVYPYADTDPSEIPPNVEALPKAPPGADKLYSSSIQYGNMDAASVGSALRGGDLVGLGLQITQSFYQPVQGMVEFSRQVVSTMGHAVVATGLGKHRTTGESFIRIRNSWGPNWGDAGNAWLPFRYVDFHAVLAFKV